MRFTDLSWKQCVVTRCSVLLFYNTQRLQTSLSNCTIHSTVYRSKHVFHNVQDFWNKRNCVKDSKLSECNCFQAVSKHLKSRTKTTWITKRCIEILITFLLSFLLNVCENLEIDRSIIVSAVLSFGIDFEWIFNNLISRLPFN